jgi:hypothetical protein
MWPGARRIDRKIVLGPARAVVAVRHRWDACFIDWALPPAAR